MHASFVNRAVSVRRVLLFATAATASAFLVACGGDGDAGGGGGDCVGDTNVNVNLNVDSSLAFGATQGIGTYETNGIAPDEGAAHRYIYQPQCDGTFGASFTDLLGGAPPEGFEFVISYAASSVPTDVAIDSANATVLGASGSIDVNTEDGPYVLFVPPIDGCFEYMAALEATCPVVTAEDCTDGIDNDQDGAIDCDDQDCQPPRSLECLPPNRCPPETDDDDEDNNTQANATVIDIRDLAESAGYGQFDAPEQVLRHVDDDRDGRFDSDEDWYRIEVCEGARLFIELTADSFEPDAPLAEPDAPYVIEVTAPDGTLDSRSFFPDRENGRSTNITYTLGEREPLPVFVRVRHEAEDSCSRYGLTVGMNCGPCFGWNSLDGEDLSEPNETCLGEELGGEEVPPFDSSLSNDWPPNLENLDEFRVDRDWRLVEVCPGGTLTASTLVPEGPMPEYTLSAFLPDGVACEVAEPIDSVTGQGDLEVSVSNTTDSTQNAFLLMSSEELGACMRYELDYEVVCP